MSSPIALQLLTVVLGSVCVVMFIYWSVCLYALLREVETTSQTKVFHYATLVFVSQVNATLLGSPIMAIDHSRNTITYHNVLCLSPQNFA